LTTINGVGNPCHFLEQSQKCGGVKSVNVIPTLLLLINRYPTAIQIYTNDDKKNNLHRFTSFQKDYMSGGIYHS